MRKAVIILAYLIIACTTVFAQGNYLQAEILSDEAQCIFNKDFSAEIVHNSVIRNQYLYFTLSDGRLIQLNLRNFRIKQKVIGRWCHLPPQLYNDLIAVVADGSNVLFLDEELTLHQEITFSNYLALPPFFFDSITAVYFENGSLQLFDIPDWKYIAHYYIPRLHSKPKYNPNGYLEISTDTETHDDSFNWYLYETDGTVIYSTNINELPFRESGQNENCRLSSQVFLYDGDIIQFTSTGLKFFKPRNRTTLSEMLENLPNGSEIQIRTQLEQPAVIIATNQFFYISSWLSEPRLGYYRLNIQYPVSGEVLQSFTSLQDNTYSNVRDIDNDGIPELIIIQDFGTIYSTNRQQRLVWHDIYEWNSNRMAFEWASIHYPDYYTAMITYYNQSISSPPFINQFYAGEYKRWAAVALDMANSVVTIERQVRQQQSSPHRNNRRYRNELAKWYTDWGITAYRRSFDNLALFSFQQALSIQPKSVKIHYSSFLNNAMLRLYTRTSIY